MVILSIICLDKVNLFDHRQKYSYFYKRVKRKSKFVLVFAENVLLKQGEKGRLIWNR